MSKLDDLIRELCPDGVEYKTIKDLFNTRNGYTPSKNNNEYWQDGTIPWFRMEDIREHGSILSDSIQHVNKKAVKGDLFPENAIIVATSATIGEHALITVPSISNQRFTYLMAKDEWAHLLDMKFVYYYCYKLDEWCLSHLNQGNFASVDMKQFAKFRFPVPPLEVQREIVRILDHFTLLTAELTAELTARKKQYEYYRNILLTFPAKTPIVKLGDIATITRGGNFQKKDFVESGYPCIHYGQMYTHFGVSTTDVIKYLDENVYNKSKHASTNDIVMAVTSENVEDVCSCTAWIGEDEIAVSGHTAIIHHNQNAKYLSYYFHTEQFFRQKQKLAHGTKVIEVTPSKLLNITVPLPSIGEQERIVRILDRFDNLCNDISKGLPAEIEARQKQYEYYRDKLLTFKEKKKTKIIWRKSYGWKSNKTGKVSGRK